jgi:protein-S-isoprenylcysteine O-methyltransferase Ste14
MAVTALMPDQPLYLVPSPWLYLMLAGQFVAVIMLVVGVLQTDTLSFIGISQILGRESSPGLVTNGLYRWMRHPLYTAGLLFLWLTPEMTVNRLVFYTCVTLYILIGAYFEERKLVREFGKEYEDYRAKTPMLVPFLPW